MLRSLFANIPDVTKNLLILNILFFLAKIALDAQGINSSQLLGMHYPTSNLFMPYQIVTHFFMHGDLFHILFNMIGLVVIGSHLERVWGKKRFAFFYFFTAIGAAILHTVVQGIEIYNYTGYVFPDISEIKVYSGYIEYYAPDYLKLTAGNENVGNAASIMAIPTVGASGAIYGLLAAFAFLFPNTQFMLLFPPIPIKAKWLALILAGIAIYSGYRNTPGDSIAHFAHLGGMLFGLLLVFIWKRNRNRFY